MTRRPSSTARKPAAPWCPPRWRRCSGSSTERYSPDNWNIYAAQASDGDNTASDNDKTAALLTNVLLPACQYYAYLEVGRDSEHFPPGFIRRDSDLWQTYSDDHPSGAPMAMRKVGHRRDIYPVFRELFAKKTGAEAAAE